MTKFCCICWELVVKDGGYFYCVNDHDLLSKDYINWIGDDLVFDSETGSVCSK